MDVEIGQVGAGLPANRASFGEIAAADRVRRERDAAIGARSSRGPARSPGSAVPSVSVNEIVLGGGRAAADRGRRPLGDDAPVRDHGDAIGEVGGLVHRVRRQKDGRAGRAQAARSCARRRVAPPGRTRWWARRGTAARGARQGPGRRRAGGAGRRRARVAMSSRRSSSPTSASVSAAPRGCGVVAGVQLDRLAHGQSGIRLRLLQHDADPAAPRAGRAERVGAEDADVAVGALPEPLEDLDRRRLARAVRAEEGEHLAATRTSRSMPRTASTSP